MLTRKDLPALIQGWNQLAANRQQNDYALALQRFLKGSVGDDGKYQPGVESASQSATEAAQTQGAKDLESQYMQNHPGFHGSFEVGPHGTKISENQQVVKPSMMLTPAQQAAEADAGKKIADFEGGGKQAGEANVSQIQGVQDELQAGKRDAYDRTVGGALENHPTLMAFFAPSEKARRDRVQNSMLSMLHDAGIPRPTQWDIQRVFGQVYDPASDDQTNTARLTQAMTKISAHNQALQSQANQYHQTGYATMGAQQPQAPRGPAQPPQQQQQVDPMDAAISAALQKKAQSALQQQTKQQQQPQQPGVGQ